MLKDPVDKTLKFVVEALVIVPLVDQKVGRVAYVVEALVIVPLVAERVVSPVIEPPVIETSLAFWVAIVPRPEINESPIVEVGVMVLVPLKAANWV